MSALRLASITALPALLCFLMVMMRLFFAYVFHPGDCQAASCCSANVIRHMCGVGANDPVLFFFNSLLAGYDAEGNEAVRDDYQKGVRMAQTMAINYITIAELLRAYTCRSLRRSIFSLGTNKWMHVSVLVAIAAMAFVSVHPCVLFIV